MDRRTSHALGLALLLIPVLACCVPAASADGFVTTTFGSGPPCEHPGALKVEGNVVRFDLAALPGGTKVQRATLRVGFRRGSRRVAGTKVLPVGLPDAKPLATCPPAHRSLDATEAVKAWVANPGANKGLKIVSAGRADFRKAVLEVSYLGKVKKPMPAVTELKVTHRNGQAFLAWKEIEDVVGKDDPTFEEFEKAVLDARAKRKVVYRIYRHDKPITPGGLGRAKLIREVPGAVSCWNLLAIANTEHPRGRVTKRSPLRGGNLVLKHVMTRWRMSDDVPQLPRDAGVAVFTVGEPGKRCYAVTVAIDGREAVTALKPGRNAAGPIDEKPSRFPAIIYQRTRKPSPRHGRSRNVDVFVCWLEEPYVPRPRPVEVYIPRWRDLPAGSAVNRLPLYVNLGTYGSTASTLSSPMWHGARRYVRGALTVGLAEEGTLWAGMHESIGTLRGYDEGVVMNYGQRRVLATTAWAVQNREFFIDPERVCIWGQFAGWALRHADVYAVVMSNGHNNFRTSREGRKHGWKWGAMSTSRNWLGVNHWDYLNLAKWVRENPALELPFWVGSPAYGAFPDHTLGDFGFKPWQDFVTAMQASRRAFTVQWMSNGFGKAAGVLYEMVPKIKRHQSLPAFSNCSLDSKILTDSPKGSYRPGKYDQDFQKSADKVEGINLHQRWDTETIVDQPGRWAMTVWLASPNKRGRYGAPANEATMDLTPRRCRKFKPKPGEKFNWTNTLVDGSKVVATGTAEADKRGLVTAAKLKITKAKHRIEIKRQR